MNKLLGIAVLAALLFGRTVAQTHLRGERCPEK